ncbi:hypothetical protein EYF80_020639 [Liparis tanakae]|uniref:Uncharacterized protein n=1 Tax=Liparis tanakae TaxID=230148 RepID=A0A4Z2HWA2_9TELE|nr:hypothetical protein EYF80_020639 [Liparis tanakae]
MCKQVCVIEERTGTQGRGNGWNHRAADQEYRVRNRNTAHGPKLRFFRVSCGPDMHALPPPPSLHPTSPSSHAQSPSKLLRKQTKSRRSVNDADVFPLNPSSPEASGSGFGMPRASPGCQMDILFLFFSLDTPASQFPSFECTTSRSPERDVVVRPRGDRPSWMPYRPCRGDPLPRRTQHSVAGEGGCSAGGISLTNGADASH